MKCPECGRKILPLRAILTGKWTNIKCRHCGNILTRKNKNRVLVVYTIVFVGYLLVNHFSPYKLKIWFFVLNTGLWILIAILIEFITVRLTKANQ